MVHAQHSATGHLPLSETAPVLRTVRLQLRLPKLADFEEWVDYFASDRSVHEGGPFDRQKAWLLWASDVACWPLRGYGAFAVEDRDSAAYLGEVGIYHRDNFPGPELGWFLRPEAEGKGYAAEAAEAVLEWIGANFDWRHVVSIIDPANARSIALGLRIGGVIDPNLPGIDEGDIVIRHDMRRVA